MHPDASSMAAGCADLPSSRYLFRNATCQNSDDKARIGYLSCKICGQKFSADTTPLDQPIDVYSLWIDACEDVANEQER